MQQEYDLELYRRSRLSSKEPQFPASLTTLFSTNMTKWTWATTYSDIYELVVVDRHCSIHEILLFILFTLRDFYARFRREAPIFGQLGIARYIDYNSYLRITESCKTYRNYSVTKALYFVRSVMKSHWTNLPGGYFFEGRTDWQYGEVFLTTLIQQLSITSATELVQTLNHAAFNGKFPQQAWPDLPLDWRWISNVAQPTIKRKKHSSTCSSKKQKRIC